MAASQLMPGPPTLSQRSQPKECPQTPVGRLPLAELIADIDENASQPLDMTPIERVLWHHVPSSSQLSSSQPTSMSKQGRKRARSSSPASSSQNETSTHFPDKKQPLDLPALQKALKTPQADPAADLWTRYALKAGIGRDGSPTRDEGIFAGLLRSSSPQTPSSHLRTRELGSLRRSNSCANEWPVSAAKRRRLNNTGSQNQALHDRQFFENAENAKTSRVNQLVEQVQNDLLRSRAKKVEKNEHLESSPPPVEDMIDNHSQTSHALDAYVNGDQESDHSSSTYTSSALRADLFAVDNDCGRDPEKNSEFEDDDFDDDDLLASLVSEHSTDIQAVDGVESASTVQTARGDMPASVKSSALSEIKLESITSAKSPKRLDSAAGQPQAPELPQEVQPLRDDFEEDDDDMSAADLENLVAVYDQKAQLSPRKSQQGPVSQKATRKPLSELDGANTSRISFMTPVLAKAAEATEVSSDEEFGEEADFDNIMAQCEVASRPTAQSVSKTTIRNSTISNHQRR